MLLLIAQMRVPLVEGYISRDLKEIIDMSKMAQDDLLKTLEKSNVQINPSLLDDLKSFHPKIMSRLDDIQRIKNSNERKGVTAEFKKTVEKWIKDLKNNIEQQISKSTNKPPPTSSEVDAWFDALNPKPLSSTSKSSEWLSKASENRITVDKVNELIDSKIGKIATDVRDVVNGQLSKFDQKITALEAKTINIK